MNKPDETLSEIELKEIAKNEKCAHCGAKLNKYWHHLNAVLVRALVKTLLVVKEQNENLVQKADLDLTHSEYGNYQKLRFHALIAKSKDEEGRFNGWLITNRGGQFLRGEITVPAKVQTFRNHVIDHSTETVHIRDLIGEVPFAQTDFEPEVATDEELQQASMFNIPPIQKSKSNNRGSH
jgi:hypothetical protein